MDTHTLIHQCYLCRGLDPDELAAVVEITFIRSLSKGEMLFLQGDPAGGFFVLLSGAARVYKASAEGKEYTLHQIRPGQMFAEATLFGGDLFPANCIATEASTVAFFPRDKFVRLIKSSPAISLKMIAGLCSFVREFNQQIEDLSLKEVPARLAAHLLRRAESSGESRIILDTTKTELAQSLGTVSETLSRALKKISDSGAIAVEGKDITILDRPRLVAIADGEKL